MDCPRITDIDPGPRIVSDELVKAAMAVGRGAELASLELQIGFTKRICTCGAAEKVADLAAQHAEHVL